MKDNVFTCTGKGGNAACRKAHRGGRSIHISPGYSAETPALVLPTYHFTTEDEARTYVATARANAVMITTDEELYRARTVRMPYLLPVGWVDPSRR